MVKVKILIIDDEEDYCMIMKAYLEDKNCEVITAYTLKEGLKKLEDNLPDILFLDNNLPDGEGWQHALELNSKYPSMKINLISAYKQKTREFDPYPNIKVWEKPISIEELDEISCRDKAKTA